MGERAFKRLLLFLFCAVLLTVTIRSQRSTSLTTSADTSKGWIGSSTPTMVIGGIGTAQLMIPCKPIDDDPRRGCEPNLLAAGKIVLSDDPEFWAHFHVCLQQPDGKENCVPILRAFAAVPTGKHH